MGWKAFLDVANDHLKDTAQILPLRNRARDVIQKTHSLELRLELALRFIALADLDLEIAGGLRELRGALFHPLLEHALPFASLPGQLQMRAHSGHELTGRERFD